MWCLRGFRVDPRPRRSSSQDSQWGHLQLQEQQACARLECKVAQQAWGRETTRINTLAVQQHLLSEHMQRGLLSQEQVDPTPTLSPAPPLHRRSVAGIGMIMGLWVWWVMGVGVGRGLDFCPLVTILE